MKFTGINAFNYTIGIYYINKLSIHIENHRLISVFLYYIFFLQFKLHKLDSTILKKFQFNDFFSQTY